MVTLLTSVVTAVGHVHTSAVLPTQKEPLHPLAPIGRVSPTALLYVVEEKVPLNSAPT
jgi:hypothetical protein